MRSYRLCLTRRAALPEVDGVWTGSLGWMIARVICSASSVACGHSKVGLLIRREMTPWRPDHRRSASRRSCVASSGVNPGTP